LDEGALSKENENASHAGKCRAGHAVDLGRSRRPRE
jgi:hypothetical protein